MCAALAPLLPLLSLGKLDPDEGVSVREHVTTCDYCRGQLREFDALRDALRRQRVPASVAEQAVSTPVRVLTLDTILGAVHVEGGGDGDDAGAGAGDERAGRYDPVTAPPLGTPRPGTALAHLPRRGRGRGTRLGALAATLLLALLAGALFRWHAGPPAGTTVTVPGLGTLTEFPLHTPLVYLSSHLVAGRDGNLWFTESVDPGDQPGKIGRITPQGIVTEFPLPVGVVPYGMRWRPARMAASGLPIMVHEKTIWARLDALARGTAKSLSSRHR